MLRDPVLVTPRVRASLAAALLAGSAVAAPVTAVAKVPKERAHAPQAGAAQDDEVDPGIDLEVETDVLPNEEVTDDGEARGVVPDDEVGTDDVPVEGDVVYDYDGQAPEDAGEPAEDRAGSPDPVADAPQPPAPADDPVPVAENQLPSTFSLAERASPRAAAEQARELTFVATQAAKREPRSGTHALTATAAVPAGAEPVRAASATADTREGTTTAFHIVQPGETLWSIARDLLGPNASTAEIAREVDRLWRLNAKTIGTGDPNLIHTGMKLRIR